MEVGLCAGPKGVVLKIEVVYGNGPLWQVLKVWS